jgi:hypothetical protein
MADKRKSYPIDVSDEECGFCVRYLTLMTETLPNETIHYAIIQWLALVRSRDLFLANDAQRSAALECGVSRNPGLDQRWGLRSDGARFAVIFRLVRGSACRPGQLVETERL